MSKKDEALKLAIEAADELEWMLKSGYEQGREGPPRVHRLIGKIKALVEQPAQRKPLTDEEIVTVAKSIDIEFKDEGYERQLDDILTFARAIEAKLKEKNA